MLSHTFKLKIKVSKEHLNSFVRQGGAVLNPSKGFNMSKQLSNRIRALNSNKGFDRSKQLSNKIRGVTGQELIIGFNKSKHGQNRLSKQYISKEG